MTRSPIPVRQPARRPGTRRSRSVTDARMAARSASAAAVSEPRQTTATAAADSASGWRNPPPARFTVPARAAADP